MDILPCRSLTVKEGFGLKFRARSGRGPDFIFTVLFQNDLIYFTEDFKISYYLKAEPHG